MHVRDPYTMAWLWGQHRDLAGYTGYRANRRAVFRAVRPLKIPKLHECVSSGQLGRLRKRVCDRRFKLCLLLLFAAQLVLFGLYTASQPIGSYPALLPSTGTSLFVRQPRVSCMSAGYIENAVIDLTSKLLHWRRCFSALHPHSSALPRRSFLS